MKKSTFQSEDEEVIDIKSMILKNIHHWKLFAVSFFVFMTIALLYNRYYPKTYSASTSILVSDDNSYNSPDILGDLQLFGDNVNINNEKGILKSFSLVKRTLKKSGDQISYHYSGRLRSIDIFDNSPFKIYIDYDHQQLINTKFFISILSEDEFLIRVEGSSDNFFDLKNENYIKKFTKEEFTYEEKFSFNEWVESEFFKFRVEKNNFDLFKNLGWDSYFFNIYSLDELTKRFQKRISINEMEKDASLLKVSLSGNNPSKITQFLDIYSEQYLQIGLDEKNKIALNTISFINDQLLTISDSLSSIEAKLENFKLDNPKIALSQKDYGTFFQLEELEREKAVIELNNKYYLSLKSYLLKNDDIKNIVAPSAMGINDPLLNTLINELSKLYSEIEVITINTKEKHPAYQSLLTKIKNTKLKLLENIENIINSSEISLNDINDRILNYDEIINNLPKNERLLVNIQRKYNINESTYNFLLEKRAEAAIAKAGNVADHQIVDKARLDSREPIYPKTKIVFAFALFIAFILPLSYVILTNIFNDKIFDYKDLEKSTDLPIIGSILHNEKNTNLVAIKNPKSSISEAFRSIRTNIQYLASDKDKKIICLTSSISGEGKTFCSMNLASIFALTGNKTILIGADMRKPKIFDDFNLKNEEGLSTLLIKNAKLKDVIQQTAIDDLDVILSGPTPPNPSELLEKKEMIELIQNLQKDYKFIIMDTPPVGLVTDGLILMKHSDVNLFIVRQAYTTKKMINKIDDLFNEKNIKNLNLIINDVNFNSRNYGYDYGYGYGSFGYGYYEEDSKDDYKSIFNFFKPKNKS